MMKLGIISHYNNEDLLKVKSYGLSHVEFCINNNHEHFLAQLKDTNKQLMSLKFGVLSVGRWGTERILATGINSDEHLIDLALIDAAHQLGAKVYVVGCNKVESLSIETQMRYTLSYLSQLKEKCDQHDMKLAIYNCRWGNFITGPETWEYILDKLPGIGIKYDPSHAIRDDQDYLKEVLEYGAFMYHIHLKGTLKIGDLVVDDPPAGLDSTQWQAFMALLYYHGYQGGLSIEPHSKIWTNTLGDSGVLYTKQYFLSMILEDDL